MQVLAEAKEAVKTYDPELETEESTEIINAYKSLKNILMPVMNLEQLTCI